MSRADRFTSYGKTLEYYSDFLMNLDFHPATGDIARVTNEDSIKQSLKNLILINYGEIPYESSIGSKITYSLFEHALPDVKNLIRSLITETIINNEPRVEINEIIVNFPTDFEEGPDSFRIGSRNENGVYVTIVFTIINTSQVVELDLILYRVR